MKKRSYNQNCALSHALDIIGERWSFLLTRELLTGPKRYKDLLEGLNGIGANLLDTRLNELDQAGIVNKKILPPPAGSVVYHLTEFGKQLEPAILELVKWGLQLDEKNDPDYLSKPEWDIIAMRALFQPEKARGIRKIFQLQIDKVVYHILIEDGTVEIELGEIRCPDVILKAEKITLSALAKGMDIEKAIQSGNLQITGRVDDLKKMLDVFSA